MAGSRDVLGRAKLAPGFLVSSQFWLPLNHLLRAGVLALHDRGCARGAAGHPGVKHGVGRRVGLPRPLLTGQVEMWVRHPVPRNHGWLSSGRTESAFLYRNSLRKASPTAKVCWRV